MLNTILNFVDKIENRSDGRRLEIISFFHKELEKIDYNELLQEVLPHIPNILKRLISIFKEDENEDIRLEIFKFLWESGINYVIYKDIDSLRELISAVFDAIRWEESTKIRVEILDIIWQGFSGHGLTEELMIEYIDGLIQTINDENEVIRTSIVKVLGSLITGYHGISVDDIESLFIPKNLYDKNRNENNPFENVITALLEILKDDPHDYTRLWAIRELDCIASEYGEKKSERIVIGIIDAMLYDENEKNKKEATEAVNELAKSFGYGYAKKMLTTYDDKGKQKHRQVDKNIYAKKTTNCFYCGFPIEKEYKLCPNCGEKLLNCIVCKLSISFGEDIGKCSLCEAVGHLNHLHESVKVYGKCPACLQKLPLEGIVPVSETKK